MRELLLKLKSAFKIGALKDFYFENKIFRIKISLLFGLIFSAAYLIFNLISGIIYRSPSFITVAIYYTLLASVRYIILKSSPNSKNDDGERLACKRGGILLLITDLLITLMIFYSVNVQSERQYGALVFTVLGVHTLYSIISGIFGIIEGKRDGVPSHRAAYTVKIAAASMSLFNLMSAIIASFVFPDELAEALTLILGGAVSLSVFLLSCSMIFFFFKER